MNESQTSISFSSSSNSLSFTTNKYSTSSSSSFASVIKQEINNKDNPIYVDSDSEDDDLEILQPDFPSPPPSNPSNNRSVHMRITIDNHEEKSAIAISPMNTNPYSLVYSIPFCLFFMFVLALSTNCLHCLRNT